jgi:CheY-like chemotaxis protein
MLVEDEPDILQTTEALMTLAGFRTVTAAHPGIALDLLRTQTPDLIVTDYMMPWMDGKTFVRKVKSDPRFRRVPVILLSAVEQADGPWDGFLRKPAAFGDLLALVRKLLEARP